MLKKLITLANVAFLIVAILLVLNIIKAFRQEKIDIDASPLSRVASSKENLLNKKQIRDYPYYSNNILRRDLFNSQSAGESLRQIYTDNFPSIAENKLPQTNLNLILKGTIIAGSYGSFAIIEDLSSRRQGLYRVGDKILDGEIIAIYRKQIILKRENRKEMMCISGEDNLSKLLRKKENGEVAKDAERENSLLIFQEGQVSKSEEEMGENKGGVLNDKMNDILGNYNISPYLVGGRQEGYSLSEVSQDSPLFKLGVREGDIIKEVNGVAIDSPGKIIQAYLFSKEKQQVEVVIEREGQREVLSEPFIK